MDGEFSFIKPPARSKWSWSFGPDFSIVWTPVAGDEPNAFHRFMQRWCLGIHWRKDKDAQG